ncbi:MAG: ArsR family transcriptional regulator [Fidelibacterota bacterium]|nr:MAG: ArsR family transcriptional regulator [Candidatus Neomarinimicrobiota bacterium]
MDRENPAQTTKQVLFGEFARLAKAHANPIRLELIDLLSQAPRTVEVLAEMIAQSVAATSHHLRSLLNARLVVAEKQGLYVTYQLADQDVAEFWVALQDMAQHHLADVHRLAADYLGITEEDKVIDRTTLMARMRRGEVTLIDVRPWEEFATGHIPGAVSVPLDYLERMVYSLPVDQEIVVCSRGPFCILSRKAVELLRRHDLRAVPLSDGIPQWRAAGLPVKMETEGASPEIG